MKKKYAKVRNLLVGISIVSITTINHCFAVVAWNIETGTTVVVDGTLTVNGDAANADAVVASGGTLTLNATANFRVKGFTMDGTLTGNSASTITASGGTFTGSAAVTVPGNLTIAGAVTLGQNVTVTTTLATGANKLTLNAKTLTIATSATTAITSSAGGGLVSENSAQTSKLSWNMGTTAGTFVIPFVTTGGTDIPLTVVTSGTDVAYVAAATYGSNAANNPKPAGITHVTGLPGDAVDRYWSITRSAGTGTPDVTFTYTAAEAPAAGETSMKMQDANTGTDVWNAAPGGQTNSEAANTVTITSFNSFSKPITLSKGGTLGAAPLPVELLSFNAVCSDKQVNIIWETASEINNHGFEVERSADSRLYAMVAQYFLSESEGNSSSPKQYMVIDASPIAGTAYYRLKQIDNNGAYEYFDAISVNCASQTGFDISSAVSNNEDQTVVLTFNTDENEIVYYTLIDYKGQRITEKSLNAQSGTNEVKISTVGINQGIYLLSVMNKEKAITNKIIIQ